MPVEPTKYRCTSCSKRVVVSFVDDATNEPRSTAGLAMAGWTVFIARDTTVKIAMAEDLTWGELNQAYRYLCPDHDPEDFVGRCYWCDSWIDPSYEPGVVLYQGDRVCQVCWEDDGFYCEDCGENYHRDFGCSVNDDRLVCEDCSTSYFHCECCGYYMERDSAVYLDSFIDDLTEDERDDINTEYEALCNYCAEDYNWPGGQTVGATVYVPNRYGINSYSYMPNNLLVHDLHAKEALYDFSCKPRGKHVRVYGWELEIESTDPNENTGNRAAEINDMNSGALFYCKSDSSIRNGYEIVSHPGTFSFWSGPGREILEPLFEKLKGLGYTSWSSGRCGLHIHTNRSAVTRLHTFNLARYVHDRNCTAKLKKLSGRTKGQLEGYAKLSLIDTFDRERGEYRSPTPIEYAKQARVTHALGDRSQAFNMSKRDTIELRLFRGSLKIDKFMASLQFYQTMLEFTNPTLGHLPTTAAIKWLDYRNYIEDYHKPKAVMELKAALQEAGI